MPNITFIILTIIISIWGYSIISILSNSFKNEKEKVFWVIAVIFIPVLSLFYVFIKKDLLK